LVRDQDEASQSPDRAKFASGMPGLWQIKEELQSVLETMIN